MTTRPPSPSPSARPRKASLNDALAEATRRAAAAPSPSVDRFARAEQFFERPAARPEPEPPPPPPPAPKVVRDTFSFPPGDHALIATLQRRLLGEGIAATKSEVLRLALTLLADRPSADLSAAFPRLERLKPGRAGRGV